MYAAMKKIINLGLAVSDCFCLSFSFQPCEQGKKLKRIHWVANIGTALKFLEGRKVGALLMYLLSDCCIHML